jgi:hypothetical protein
MAFKLNTINSLEQNMTDTTNPQSNIINATNSYYNRMTKNNRFSTNKKSAVKINKIESENKISFGSNNIINNEISNFIDYDTNSSLNINDNMKNIYNSYYKNFTKNHVLPTIPENLKLNLSITNRSSAYTNRDVDLNTDLTNKSNLSLKIDNLMIPFTNLISTNNLIAQNIYPLAPSTSINISDINVNSISPIPPATSISINNVDISNDNMTVKTLNTNQIIPISPVINVDIPNLKSSSFNTNTINPINVSADIVINDNIKVKTGNSVKTDFIEESTTNAGITLKSNSKNVAEFNNGTTTFYTSSGDGLFKIHTNSGIINAGSSIYDVCIISLDTNSSCYVDLEITNITDTGNIEIYKTVKIIKRILGDLTVFNTMDIQKHDNWSYSIDTNSIKFSNQELIGIQKQYNARVSINLLTSDSSYSIIL